MTTQPSLKKPPFIKEIECLHLPTYFTYAIRGLVILDEKETKGRYFAYAPELGLHYTPDLKEMFEGMEEKIPGIQYDKDEIIKMWTNREK